MRVIQRQRVATAVNPLRKEARVVCGVGVCEGAWRGEQLLIGSKQAGDGRRMKQAVIMRGNPTPGALSSVGSSSA